MIPRETMSRYRHSKYAGNHCDVLKHIVFIHVLQEMMASHQGGIELYDTHAGGGEYNILENNESVNGIIKLMKALPLENKKKTRVGTIESVEKYIDSVKSFNNNNNNNNIDDDDQITNIEKYPGSPAFTRLLLRPQDSHYLWELHSDIYNVLNNFMFNGDDNGASKVAKLKTTDVRISHGDGFAGLLSHLSSCAVCTGSGERKRIVLIDPPNKHICEYEQARQTFEELLTNYSQATIMLWLPILEHCQESLKLLNNLKKSIRARKKEATNNEEKRLENVCDISWTLASLTVSQSGLLGSSMFVVNPPKSFYSDMEEVLPFLAQTISKDCGEFCLTAGP